MLGLYENFPQGVHLTKTYTSALSKKESQESIIKIIKEINRKNLTFEEVGTPEIPNSTVIFEVGIADAHCFNYIDKEETQKILNIIDAQAFNILDFFCVIRYYKNTSPKKTPLKFDYYMIRLAFGKDRSVEFQIFHERGPRYIAPRDLLAFMVHKVNSAASRKILKLTES
jgi:hypothetical protein